MKSRRFVWIEWRLIDQRVRLVVCSLLHSVCCSAHCFAAPLFRSRNSNIGSARHSTPKALPASLPVTPMSSAVAAPAASPAVPAAVPVAAAAPSRPLIGIGVLIVDPTNHPGCILIGERKGSHGAATFATPGGHLEYGEEWSECGLREVKEETNLDLVAPLAHVYTTNALFPDAKKHYVTLFLQGEIAPASAPLQLMEPDKCKEWVWMSWQELKRKHAAEELNVFNTLKPLLADETFRL